VAYDIDTNWYANRGATGHITSELERMRVHDQYRGTIKFTTLVVD
jgi:hypothetical protein